MARIVAIVGLPQRVWRIAGIAIARRDFRNIVRLLLISAAWAATAIFLGIIVGFASIILPPTGVFGFVAIPGAILLWAAPDLAMVRKETIRRFFLVFTVVIVCVPEYYAFDFPGLPEISIRRITALPLIVLYLLYISTSAQARAQLASVARGARIIIIGVIGFLVMILLSVLTSIDPVYSLPIAVNSILTWFFPFFVVATVCEADRDKMLIMRAIAVCAIFVATLGIVEVPLQENIMIRIMPGTMYESMMRYSPDFHRMLAQTFRNGMYRAPSVFGTPLSFGEFAAFVAPLGAFFLFYGRRFRDRGLGFVLVVTSVLGVIASGARGGNASLIVATIVFVALSIARERRFNPHGLLAPTAITMAVVFFTAVYGITLVSHRAHDLILGADDPLSTQARLNQWELAKPKIIEQPITGYGVGTGGGVIGYGDPNFLSVDSYPLSLMVETGVPSLVFFVMMIGGSIWASARAYLADSSQRGGMNGALASALAGFATYRLVLSQRENLTLIFIMCGLIVASLGVKRPTLRGPQTSNSPEATATRRHAAK